LGEWFEDAFRADYLRVYPHRGDAEAAASVGFLGEEVEEWGRRLVGLRPGARVLDLACGAGRHLRAMEALGIRAVGADLSPDLLAEARTRGSRCITRCDMRRLPFRDGSFEAVALFFSSFGYFDSEAEDAGVLREAARVVAPEGGLLLEIPNAPEVRKRLVPSSVRMEADLHVLQERSITDGGRRVQKRVTLRHGAETRTWTESVRLYTVAEIRDMAAAAGFRVRYQSEMRSEAQGPSLVAPMVQVTFVKGKA
jgi:SAM-dependent methyltransferase